MSDDTMILALDGRQAICLDPNARHYEWVMYKHPDGQWVSLRRATVDELNRARMSVAALQTSAPNREATPPAAPDADALSALEQRLLQAVHEYDDAVGRPPSRFDNSDSLMSDVALAHGHLFREARDAIIALRDAADLGTGSLKHIQDQVERMP